MAYDIVERIEIIFNAIDDPHEIGELAAYRYTPHHMVYLVYMVISQCSLFRTNINIWVRRAPVD